MQLATGATTNCRVSWQSFFISLLFVVVVVIYVFISCSGSVLAEVPPHLVCSCVHVRVNLVEVSPHLVGFSMGGVVVYRCVGSSSFVPRRAQIRLVHYSGSHIAMLIRYGGVLLDFGCVLLIYIYDTSCF